MDHEQIDEILSDGALLSKESARLEELEKRLAEIVKKLLETNFPELIQLLYRIDVSESKLRELLRDNPEIDATLLIAKLIIERQVKKLQTREQFKQRSDPSEEDKW